MPLPDPQFADEAERLRVLESFSAAALESDEELQAIVEFAAKLCGTPVSMVTLIEHDRQLLLAREGLDQRETPREVAFCLHTLGKPDLLEVADAEEDARFADNPLVTGEPNVRYYAGQPLISEEGASLGTLCVIDTEAHGEGLSEFQRQGLAVLAQAAMRRLNARRADLLADIAIAEREERLRRMIDGVPQIAWSADSAGNFDYFNKRWVEVTGDPAPKLAEDWTPFLHPEDAPAAFAEWNRCFSAGEEFECEYRLKQADGSWRWVLSLGVPVTENAGEQLRWFGTITDIDEVHQAFEERDMLAKELSHRIKNIFAVVIGLATLMARKNPENEPFARELSEVLRSLGRAHEFVRPTGGESQESLQGLLAALLAPYKDAQGDMRVRVAGVDAEISPRAATPLALVFHELATNSAKYGALCLEHGHVDLAVEESGADIILRWTENGGPKVTGPGLPGFGSRLVEMSVTGQLQGRFERRFEEGGLEIELTVPKDAIAT